MGGKAGSKKSSKPTKTPGTSSPLAALQAVGLFTTLDASDVDDDELVRSIEKHLRASSTTPVLHSPQSANDLWSVADVKHILLDDPDTRYIHVVENGETTTYMPKTFNEWIGVYHEALRIAGDNRRLASLDVEDAEEPLYVLATDEQIRVLQTFDLLAYDWNETDLPFTVTAEERARSLAQMLTYRKVPAKADGEHVALDLDLDGLRALVARLRADVHHGRRISAYVKVAYEDEPS